jgi:chitinase
MGALTLFVEPGDPRENGYGERSNGALRDGTLSDHNIMWPPNHAMREIRIIGVSDPNDEDITIAIDRVTQDEPLNGEGDGNTDQDAVVNEDGVLLLRAERAGTGDGRVYVIEFTATNNTLGESCQGVVSIVVPPSRRSPAIDSGQGYVGWE